jgi:hypothetical protein
MTNTNNMDKEYKIDDIKKLLSKIENVKDKKHIEKIKSIIFKENPNMSTTKKSSGTLLFFHNLSQITYKKLDIFFMKLEKEKLELLSASMSAQDNNSDTYTSDKIESTSQTNVVKLSNSERKIIKRKDYYNQINNTKTDDLYVSDDDIFLKK